MEKLFFIFALRRQETTAKQKIWRRILRLISSLLLIKERFPQAFRHISGGLRATRCSVCTDKKHKSFKSVAGPDIGNYESENGSKNTLGEMIHKKGLSPLLTRTGVYQSDYRNIAVACYIEDRSVREIPFSLILFVNTVQQRLYRARSILKEGMIMVFFVMNGRSGDKGHPRPIITHLL